MKFRTIEKKYPEVTGNEILDQWIGYNGIDVNSECPEHDPWMLPNIRKAVDLTLDAVNTGREIVVAGDYDADGICGTTILVKGLDAIDGIIQYMIPDRSDGYGLNLKMVNAMPADCLLITVDNGIACVDAIAAAKAKGMTVIITDHHSIPETIPEADAIVHPQLKGSQYPFQDISGATVAYKFIKALWDAVGYRAKGLIEELQALAGITVISDVMPLQDENRTIFKRSVEYLSTGKNPNLTYILKAQGVDLEHIDETTYGFSLCPVINAIGRLSNAEYGVDFLLAETELETAARGAVMLHMNERRKSLMTEQMGIAEAAVTDTRNVICVFPEVELHEGLVGIIAGRLCQKHKKPTFVFTPLEDGNWKGSARSTKDVNIYKFLCAIKEADPSIFVGFGGHAGAAGLTITSKDAFVDQCEDAFKKVGVEYIQDFVFCNDTKNLGIDLIEKMREFAPWGNGYPRPVVGFTMDVNIAKCYFGRGIATISDDKISVDLPLEDVLTAVRDAGYFLAWNNEREILAKPGETVPKVEYYRLDNNSFNEPLQYKVVAEVYPNYFGGKESLRTEVILAVPKK